MGSEGQGPVLGPPPSRLVLVPTCLVRYGFSPTEAGMGFLSGVAVFAMSVWVLAEWPGNVIARRPNEGSGSCFLCCFEGFD